MAGDDEDALGRALVAVIQNKALEDALNKLQQFRRAASQSVHIVWAGPAPTDRTDEQNRRRRGELAEGLVPDDRREGFYKWNDQSFNLEEDFSSRMLAFSYSVGVKVELHLFRQFELRIGSFYTSFVAEWKLSFSVCAVRRNSHSGLMEFKVNIAAECALPNNVNCDVTVSVEQYAGLSDLPIEEVQAKFVLDQIESAGRALGQRNYFWVHLVIIDQLDTSRMTVTWDRLEQVLGRDVMVGVLDSRFSLDFVKKKALLL